MSDLVASHAAMCPKRSGRPQRLTRECRAAGSLARGDRHSAVGRVRRTSTKNLGLPGDDPGKSIFVPANRALVVAGDQGAPAVAVVVDLVPHPSGTIVHLDVLPGAIDSYLRWPAGSPPPPDLAPRP